LVQVLNISVFKKVLPRSLNKPQAVREQPRRTAGIIPTEYSRKYYYITTRAKLPNATTSTNVALDPTVDKRKFGESLEIP